MPFGVSLIAGVSGPKSTDSMSYGVHQLVHPSMETYTGISQDPGEAMISKKSPRNCFTAIPDLSI